MKVLKGLKQSIREGNPPIMNGRIQRIMDRMVPAWATDKSVEYRIKGANIDPHPNITNTYPW